MNYKIEIDYKIEIPILLNYFDTVHDDGTFRLDAEHYQKRYLEDQERLLFIRFSIKTSDET
ncbi:MAG: hypothetical protein KAI50_12445 [Desulfobacterales bacterium]|nr:hypothetical protein [Desulfobacterales bacterium]